MNICMAHRGWSGKVPENTMTAIRLALAEPAIKAMEIDVQLTRDGVPVLIHDFTLERTTNGRGLVMDHTLAELRELDAGSWFGDKFAGEKIPTLEEVLIAVRGRCTLNIELKATSDMYPGIAEKVLALVEKHGMKQEVYLTSFDHDLIRHVRTLDQEVQTGLIVYGRPVLMLEQMEAAGATILSMGYPFLTRELTVAAIEKGFKVIAWTLDDPKHIREVISWHPQVQICTNHPDRMWEFV
ncbi:glycerophosphodiester phosphodiesterase [Brevibacillus brevis]|uniref:glycerophosphodiester phosphodiesterase n=1 Tax=Brevibacillus brevis TaxID=1393 RepID=UPI000D0F9F87|nr:glycerophosphodiester phosphodiesterase family protein [Brevibacillus brevis]PSJ68522.1 glycerophosphodiester phosphodiesterase [Brevibacillus brevis]RED34184.1 glycerophosphoryl diester phosphodiesterase [Brevibacillus brevis]GEC93198.1 glycerophosphoryl diester phosphodiesterase [Brevibacillus brevis]VEF92246.1 Glycerophosphoryl diester phosphodiesterase [Brevibacillus brevis]